MAVSDLEGGQLGFLLSRCGLDAAALAARIGSAPAVSPLEWLAVDPEGRVWASRRLVAGELPRVDLFERDGRYIGTLRGLPMPVAFLDRARVVVFARDGDGRRVEVWRIVG